MGLFNRSAGRVQEVTPQCQTVNGMEKADSCSHALGWKWDGQKSPTHKFHRFNDPVSGHRDVHVISSETSELLMFMVFTRTQFDADDVPQNAACYLLEQNSDNMFISWRMDVDEDDDTVGFSLWAVTYASVIQPKFFSYLCETMCKQASEFEARLQKEGLL